MTSDNESVYRQNLRAVNIAKCITSERFIFINLYKKKFLFVGYITHHLKAGLEGNS